MKLSIKTIAATGIVASALLNTYNVYANPPSEFERLQAAVAAPNAAFDQDLAALIANDPLLSSQRSASAKPSTTTIPKRGKVCLVWDHKELVCLIWSTDLDISMFGGLWYEYGKSR